METVRADQMRGQFFLPLELFFLTCFLTIRRLGVYTVSSEIILKKVGNNQ